MSEMGFIAFGQEDEPIFIGREITHQQDYSEETSCLIDKEVNKIISDCMADTRRILNENKNQLDLLANALVEHETMDDAEVRVLLNLPVAQKSTTIKDKEVKSE